MLFAGLAIGIEASIIQSFTGLVCGRIKDAFDRGDLAAARSDQV